MMIKRLPILLFCLPLFIQAQDKPLTIQGVSPALYLVHVMAPKENYYSVGRMYNISPKEIAPFNNLTLAKGLALGQTIKVPLTSANFIQSGSAAGDEVLVPVYHTAKDKEGLFRISNDYNKVPVATLKKWNNISGDEVSNGTNLIVGYLKVKKGLSPLAASGAEKTNLGDAAIQTNIPEKEIKKGEPTVITQPEIKNEESVKKDIKAEPIATTDKKTTGGFFKTDYNKQTQNKEIVKENGPAAIFKSTSGWEDGKYYCLQNTAAAGTIVKVTNTATGKSIYAKVLDMIPDVKQNSGIIIRLSNSAAGQLGVNDETKFDCTLEYSK
jgi:LysM repeat protein